MTVKTIRQTINRDSTSDATMRSNMQVLRDAFRSSLQTDQPASDWIVSDIANWTNINATGYEVLAFLVRRKNSDHEWLIGNYHRSGSTSTSTFSSPRTFASLLFGNWRRENDSAVITTSNSVTAQIGVWSFFMHYNEKLGSEKTYAFDFDDPINLTYNAADFQTPLQLISAATFWPEPVAADMYPGYIRAMSLASTAFTANAGFQILFNVESEAPSLGFELKAAQTTAVSNYMAMGNVHAPNVPGDSDRTGAFGCTLGYSDNYATGHWARILTPWTHFKNDLGEYVLNGSFTIQGTYNLTNELNPDNTFKRRSINVQSASYVKGTLDPDYFFEVCALEDSSRFGLRLQGPRCSLCRTNGAFAVPFDDSIPYPAYLQNVVDSNNPPFS
jgi:hypothetical protein